LASRSQCYRSKCCPSKSTPEQDHARARDIQTSAAQARDARVRAGWTAFTQGRDAQASAAPERRRGNPPVNLGTEPYNKKYLKYVKLKNSKS